MLDLMSRHDVCRVVEGVCRGLCCRIRRVDRARKAPGQMCDVRWRRTLVDWQWRRRVYDGRVVRNSLGFDMRGRSSRSGIAHSPAHCRRHWIIRWLTIFPLSPTPIRLLARLPAFLVLVDHTGFVAFIVNLYRLARLFPAILVRARMFPRPRSMTGTRGVGCVRHLPRETGQVGIRAR
jgi:hypothetical protein